MTERNRRIVIIGATSAIAEHCARLWVSESAIDLVLVARDLEKAERVAADLHVRSPRSSIRAMQADFISPSAIATLASELATHDPIDIVLISHGSLPDQPACESDLDACREALEINAVSPVLFAEAFARHLQRQDHGCLAIIGSVAGDRGRKSNYVYGAAKGLVTRYAQGLQHRLAATRVVVTLVKPGPTDTPMTASFKARGVKLASVESVATAIVDGIAANATTIYVPRKWALIMMVIRHLPSFVFNKLQI